MSEIKIKPIANFHGLFLITLGSTLLVITILLANDLSSDQLSQYKLILLLFTLVSLVVLFIGVVKKIEPNHAYVLTKDMFNYQHKYGHCQIKWKDIQSFNSVKLHQGLELKELPYIGIKLKPEALLQDMISPRLASRLIHEQRPLTVSAISHELVTFEQAQINFSPYKGCGKEIKGPISAFMYHSDMLKQAFGFHFYLPVSSYDRPIDEFLQLLNDCLRHSNTESC